MFMLRILNISYLVVPIMLRFPGLGIDGEVAKTLQKILAKQGMKFKLGTKVTSVRKEGGGVKVEVEAAKGGNKEVVSTLSTICTSY